MEPKSDEKENELPKWLAQRFAFKTLEESEREIERVQRLAGMKLPDAREMFEREEMSPTAKAQDRLKYEEGRALKVKTEWQKRRDEMGAILLKAHDKGWKKDKQLAGLEAQHAEIVKTYRQWETSLKETEQRWERQRPKYEERAREVRERIEQAQKELPVIEQHERQLREVALNLQLKERVDREQRNNKREHGKGHGR